MTTTSHHFHWDIDPQEWQGKSAKSTAAYVIRQLARLQGRAVLLMHDTKPATAAALPEILTWLDSENPRRKAVRRRPIRIVSGPELAAEQVRPTLDWLATALEAGRTRVSGALAKACPERWCRRPPRVFLGPGPRGMVRGDPARGPTCSEFANHIVKM